MFGTATAFPQLSEFQQKYRKTKYLDEFTAFGLSRTEGFHEQSTRSSKMFRKQSKLDQINVVERENIEGLGSKIFDNVSVPPTMRQSTADLPAHPLNP